MCVGTRGAGLKTEISKRWVASAACRSVLLALLFVSGAVAAKQPVVKPSADRANLPMRKAGLWEVTIQGHAAPGARGVRQSAQTVLQCTDAKAERVMLLSILPTQENCGAFNVASSKKGSYDIAGACKVHDQRVVLNMQLRGDLNAMYGGTYSAEYPGAAMAKVGPVGFQGRWLGACKPGQRPGDMVLPNGAKVNVVDDVERAEGHAH